MFANCNNLNTMSSAIYGIPKKHASILCKLQLNFSEFQENLHSFHNLSRKDKKSFFKENFGL